MQEVSGVYTSPFHDIVGLKMTLRARNVSGSFEKRAPGPVSQKPNLIPFPYFIYIF